MTPNHVAASVAALNSIATPAAGPSVSSAGPGTVGTPSSAYDAGRAAARAAGAAEERTRLWAILNHEAAAGRGKLAGYLAFKTIMSSDDAGAMLAASAVENATATGAAGASGETIDWGEIVAGVNAVLAKGGVH